MDRVLYPGSFDPVTNGHMNIIERCAAKFDEVIVAVAVNLEKEALFTVEERVELLRESCAALKNVKADHFTGLLVDYARAQGANLIVKGLRAVSDFEFELQMALMNRRLAPNLDTIFMMTDGEYSFLSSSIVQEVARHGGSVTNLVPPIVEERLRQKLSAGC